MEGSLVQHRAGSGEPLVLVHGIGSSWRAWTPVLSALEARHEVLAVDLPGFGDSSVLPSDRRPTVEALADAVEADLARLGVDRPHVAGNSLGGWVSLELARRGRVRTATALSPGGWWNAREAAYARAVLTSLYLSGRRVRPYARTLTRTAAGRTALFSMISSRPWRIDPEEACHAMEALGGTETFLATLDESLSTRARGMEAIAVPTLIGWGSRDRLLLPRQGPRAARVIPGAELRPLPGAGHVPMWDDPDLVARTVLDGTSRRVQPVP